MAPVAHPHTCVTLSVVVPCFNEESVLHALRERLLPVCHDVAGEDFEIILVDDGSTDGTRSIMRSFHTIDPRFVGVFLSRNHGHQLALTAGLSVARGERILIIDADLQDPPELLPKMMALTDDGYDVVYGQRAMRQGETVFKRATAAFFYRLVNKLIELPIPSDTGDFRLITRRVLDVLLAMPEHHRFIRGMIAWIGFPQIAIPYDRDPRFAGETKYPLKKMIRFALDALTGFSLVPLKLATYLGFAVACFSFVMTIYVFAVWSSGSTVPGWSSTIVVVLMVGGVQLFVTGILGEYLGRLYMQSKGRPLFVVDEVLGQCMLKK